MNDYTQVKSKGSVWEYRTHRAMFASGWYLRRGIDLRERVSGAPQVMAEVDLLGISFDAGLTVRRRIVECKDRRGSGQEADRVIWLLGLGKLLEVDDLVLAKTRISPSTVRFARSTGVALFEEASVIEAENHLAYPRTAATFDADLVLNLIGPAVSRTALGDNRLREAYDWIHNASWTESPLARVKRLPGYFRLVRQYARSTTREVLLIEGLMGLLVCGLQVSGLLRRHSPAVGRGLAAESLASGAAPAPALVEIAATADDYYRSAFARDSEEQTGKRLTVSAPRLAEHIANPPRWSEAFFAFAETLGSRPELATDVLRFAELTLYERLAGRDPEPARRAFVRGDHAWLASSLALATGFCSRVWGLEDTFFSTLTRVVAPPSPRAKFDASDADHRLDTEPPGETSQDTLDD